MLKRARNQTFSNPLERGSVIEANSKPKVIKKTVNFQNNTIVGSFTDVIFCTIGILIYFV